jgi:transcriptional regulator with XRE-family HTH domain
MSLIPAQARAARAWLGINQAELAKKANLGLSTLKDFEAGKRIPIQNNLVALRQALEAAGAREFLSATDNITAGAKAGGGVVPMPTGSEARAPKSRSRRSGKRFQGGARA